MGCFAHIVEQFFGQFTMLKTNYFQFVMTREDRRKIKEEWVMHAIQFPIREEIQADGRIRRWVYVSGEKPRYLRVVLLSDGQTVHNAFFDRRFRP